MKSIKLKPFRSERLGYYSESHRNKAFKVIREDPFDYLGKSEAKVFNCLKTSHGKTLAEISIEINMPVHLVSARMNSLRKLELVIDLEKGRLNPLTGINNTVFVLSKYNPNLAFQESLFNTERTD